MAFIIGKEEVKSGLVIFRRGDVEHRKFCCRIKALLICVEGLSKKDRTKTISLHTADRESARDRAFDQDAEIRFRVKLDVAVFNRPFREVGPNGIPRSTYCFRHTSATFPLSESVDVARADA